MADAERPEGPAPADDAGEEADGPTRRERLAAHGLRVATVAVFAVCAVLLVRLFTGGDSGDDRPFELPEYEAGELAVGQAIALESGDPLLVRGFVYEGPGVRELRMCHSRTKADPPGCLGPFISLEGVDTGSFALVEGEDDEEGRFLYSPDSVLVRGTLVGTLMQVSLIL